MVPIYSRLLLTGMACLALSASAQELNGEAYVKWGTSSEKFPATLSAWSSTHQVTEDDNFFISRVKPKVRFRNVATQVRQNLDATNDKKLIAWIPVNDNGKNALPDGLYDSEVFSMWPYITHWGNWTAPLGRVPASFLDVAHKNGVGVSSVASIPYGGLSTEYRNMLQDLAFSDVDESAKFFNYYGVDGLGYNSEFSGASDVLMDLETYHADLVKKMRETNPLFENFWYDGTNDNGGITFDRGLGSHNDDIFGDGDNIRTSLFFNYNWNTLNLQSSVDYAKSIGRDPLDLYCGVNMQGGEPRGTSWPLLQNVSLSIGLWGAHNENMFWESRGEKGSTDDTKQRTYMLRTERWFTGGSRNPVTTPAIISSMSYNADNYKFHGMSSFMTARSSLSWDLSTEPFVSYFNLGNGKFFNWMGEQANSNSWYNIGVQDYLPTWRWWFASKLLGRTAADVPASGLDAQFVWDDAYFGGSTLQVYGTSAEEYLHLFKTEFGLKAGDVITVRYKLLQGQADMDLVLSAKGSEDQAQSYSLMKTSQEVDDETWVKQTFTVGTDFDGKDLALVALHFRNASNLSLYLGEFSIVRGSYAAPAKPEVTSSTMITQNYTGMDGKIIFNMPNSKPEGEVCYNLDVNTSMFKLYAQQEGKDPILMGATTSWAGLYYSIPTDFEAASRKMRLGVSAVSLDMQQESEIAWSDYMEPVGYVYNDNIQSSKTTIKPNESFELSYADNQHESGKWQIVDAEGNEVFSGEGVSVQVEGLSEIGSYDLKVTGMVYGEDGTTREETTRTFSSYIQITSESVGALPEIYTLTANDKEDEVSVAVGDDVNLAYTGRSANGSSSRGIDLKEKHFVAKCSDLGIAGQTKSFSVTYWIKLNVLNGDTQLFSIVDRASSWPKTDWGWLWVVLNSDGGFGSYTFRGTDASGNNELQYTYGNTKLPIGNWVHIAHVFDYDNGGNLLNTLYVNGVKQTVTAWKRSNGEMSGEPTHAPNVYKIEQNMLMQVGGDAYGRAGIDGSLDNLMFWDKAITADEVKASMGDIDESAMPSGLACLWTIETDADAEDGTYAAVGSMAGVKAGSGEYYTPAGAPEGYKEWSFKPSSETSGSPFLSGTAYTIETLPTWKANKATLVESTGNDQAGSAKFTYAKDGIYSVTLTLANSLGSASKTFQTITVGDPTGIEDANASELRAYTVGEDVLVEFAEAGNYNVAVYNVAGQQVAGLAQQLNAGNNVKLHLGVAGTYVVKVTKDGKVVKTVKLLRK